MTASYFDVWKRGEDMAADGSLKFDTKLIPLDWKKEPEHWKKLLTDSLKQLTGFLTIFQMCLIMRARQQKQQQPSLLRQLRGLIR